MAELRSDLVLEGGGVKGIGLVGAVSVLAEAGYSFPRVAGTSAGAVVGALVAAGMSPTRMREVMEGLDYRRFRDRSLLDRVPLVGRGLSLLFERGIYEGKYLVDWITRQLAEQGVRTFADLKIQDAGSDLPRDQAYRLVVLAADVSRGRLVRLPWDYHRYGLDPDRQLVADAVRASMSIPFFFEPVRLGSPANGGGCCLVDGGVLSNFPVDSFDRGDGRAPRWPTFGIKLSARPEALARPAPVGTPLQLATALFSTMAGAMDQRHLEDPHVLARTTFVDTLRVRPTDFDLDATTRDALYRNGREAARRFLSTWDFDAYVREFRTGAPTLAAV